MKYKIFAQTVMGAVLMTGMASCTSDNDSSNVIPDEKGMISLEIRSGINGGGRTALSGTDVVFQNGDKLAVWDGVDDKVVRPFSTDEDGSVVKFTGEIKASATNLNILYPLESAVSCSDDGIITATIPTEQTATENTFDPKANLSVATATYTKGQNVTCTLQNVCGLLKFKIAEVDGYAEYDYVEISDAAETKQNIAGTVTINPAADTPQATDGDKTVITLKAGSGQTLKADSSTVYYVVLKPGTFTNGIEMKFYKDGADKYGTATLTKTGGGTLSITPGVILNAGVVTPVLKKAPPKPLSGKFSVSSSKKVSFAPGNLRATWNGTGYDWAFAEHQWDYIGDASGNKGIQSDGKQSTAGNVVDLFGWTAAGKYSDGIKQYGINTSQTNSDYGSSTSDKCCEWGSLITTGGPWRTLSNAEWGYLLTDRKVTVSGSQKVSYGEGTVNGVSGLIILPDSWDGSVCPGFFYGDLAFTNTFSETTTPKWSEMESAGCVFLPCAGYRNGSTMRDVGSYGAFWSSSPYASNASYNVRFLTGNVTPQGNNIRFLGRSVRLVCASE